METMLPSAASIVIQQRSVGGHLRPEANVLALRFSAPNRAADTSAMTKAGARGPVSPNQLVSEKADCPICTKSRPISPVFMPYQGSYSRESGSHRTASSTRPVALYFSDISENRSKSPRVRDFRSRRNPNQLAIFSW